MAPASANLEVASYRDTIVSVKRLAKTSVMLSRVEHVELKTVSTQFIRKKDSTFLVLYMYV